ncbi:ABC transporter permease [Mucilaginibacter phyllosphaerae]|uniref:ABC transporter permease n=1 Tax=Mucilaginibacter phyllosphaerae TaxID=1812349 RepID=A0A4Y8A824_9SPHI|nr:ABC transporter permease [Mucilaginibacter phyllosphaerae]MBB3970500.1 ABC-type antimicrobial peptide transport system permease subunit [Mucilaginibacter phyllosphaerae]TEW64515.1 ABC transporter permease [Mucilaginibacter phyllosphaerae]GGH19164.1 ABC transporter permease [Mucilaginibacter phyllosphaerae]
MFKTYLKLAYRNITKDKAYAIINITGLAIGLASSILILLWVQNELSYDKFHKNAGQIYRISNNLDGSKTTGSPAGLPAAIRMQMPAIKSTVRLLSGYPSVLLESGNNKFEEKRAFYADPAFMDVFSYTLLKGDKATALKQTDGVLITQATALKYFGNQDPMGKVMRKDNKDNVVVTGVLADVPANSDLQFDLIFPLAALAKTNNDLLRSNIWGNFSFYTYVLLNKSFNASPANLTGLEKQIDQIFHQNNPEMKASFQLQPLTKIHLAPAMLGELPGHGNAQYVSVFFIVAILILIVACINFMNLATARSARRAKEIGLRKTAGALRGQLIIQFLTESIFISFLSLLFAVGVVYLFLPAFNELANRKLSINIGDIRLWFSLFGIALFTGLVSGSYPAFFLSGFNPVKVLKGNVKSMGGNLLFRNTLVVIQFMVSIILLVGTVVIYDQLKFIKERNPGFEKANLLYVPMTGEMWNKQQALKDELGQNPLTNNFAVITDLPTNLGGWTTDARWDGQDLHKQTAIPIMGVNEDFIRTFGIQIIAGRSFSNAFKTDSAGYMINEKMALMMGLNAKTALGKSLTMWGSKGTIVGVVKDFNFKPVQQSIEPLIMPFNKIGGYVVVKTLPGKTNATIQALTKISKGLNPAYPFKYDFLDQELSNLYKGEQQMGNIFNLFAALGVFISCLGLYGLSAFMAEQRTKEIGVRKVLGASVLNLVYLLSSGITRLILIAIVIAIPISWYAVNSWLADFAYHINVSWLVFFTASVAALGIAWLTVSYESVKAAVVNPIKSLRTE